MRRSGNGSSARCRWWTPGDEISSLSSRERSVTHGRPRPPTGEQRRDESMAVDTRPTLDDAAVQAFAAGMRGTLIRPDDPAYDDARKLYNAMIDKRPALIARCVDA